MKKFAIFLCVSLGCVATAFLIVMLCLIFWPEEGRHETTKETTGLKTVTMPK